MTRENFFWAHMVHDSFSRIFPLAALCFTLNSSSLGVIRLTAAATAPVTQKEKAAKYM